MPSTNPYLTIALPVKDGEARLGQMLEQVDALVGRLDRTCEVIAVDDGSVDATARLLADFAAVHPYLKVVTHERNRGKGAALKTAAAASNGELLLTMDADATYSLDVVDAFLEALESGHDAAIGNRRDRRSQFVLHPRDFAYIGRRHTMGWIYGVVARLLGGLRVKDSQAGFKAYRGEVARKLFPQVEAERFAFDVEILALLQFYRHPIAELPVIYVYRHQPSTVHLFRDGFRMLRRLLTVRLKLRRLRRSGRFADHTRGDYQHLARTEGHPIQRFWHAKKWPMVADSLEFSDDDRVLDVGAGSSEIAAKMRRRCAFACATDFATAPLAHLSEEGAGNDAGADSRVCFVGADIHALPFKDGSFDKVVVLEVIEHIPRDGIPRYFGELRRVLAPGGQLLVTTPNYRSSWPVLEWLVDHLGGAAEMGGKQHICRFHPRMLREALEQNGFRVTRRGSVYHLSPFVSLVAPRLAEKIFTWELGRGGSLGPILYSVAESATHEES